MSTKFGVAVLYIESCPSHLLFVVICLWSSSVSIVIDTGWTTGIRFPTRAGVLLHHRVQTGSAAHPAFHPMDTGGSFPGGRVAGS
jgi:hypothetical protein